MNPLFVIVSMLVALLFALGRRLHGLDGEEAQLARKCHTLTGTQFTRMVDEE